MPALQQPQWPDRGALQTTVRRLEGLPPLVLAAECDQLKERLASVARGEAFLLQGGDCAETFAGTTAGTIRGKVRTLLQMAVVLTYAASVPVVKVGRKPGKPSETHDTGVTIEAIAVRSFGKWAVRLWLGVASQASL